MSNRTEAAQRKLRQLPPGDYRHCACSRLYQCEVLLHFSDFDFPGLRADGRAKFSGGGLGILVGSSAIRGAQGNPTFSLEERA